MTPVPPTSAIPFEREIRAAADKHGIPYDLLVEQVRQESHFDNTAVSHRGARGLLQLMPATAKDYGVKESELFDPALNLMAGAMHLRKHCYRSCKSQVVTMPREMEGKPVVNACTEDDFWQLALATYNGGLGYVIKAINLCALDGEPLCWKNIAPKLGDKRLLVRVKGKLLNPDEKQMIDYVEKIWASYKKRVSDQCQSQQPTPTTDTDTATERS